MKTDQTTCDDSLLNRFFDRELGPDECTRISEHLKDCPSCQKALRGDRSISTAFKTHLGKELSRTNLEKVEERVLTLIQSKEVSWWTKAKDLLFSKKFYVPATGIAAILILFFSYSRQPRSTSSPSAIINSFKGDVASVMILETRNSHQTILWFDETVVSDEDNGTERNTNQGLNFFKKTASTVLV